VSVDPRLADDETFHQAADDSVLAHCAVYFGVDDTDAALAKIIDLGGRS